MTSYKSLPKGKIAALIVTRLCQGKLQAMPPRPVLNVDGNVPVGAIFAVIIPCINARLPQSKQPSFRWPTAHEQVQDIGTPRHLIGLASGAAEGGNQLTMAPRSLCAS